MIKNWRVIWYLNLSGPSGHHQPLCWPFQWKLLILILTVQQPLPASCLLSLLSQTSFPLNFPDTTLRISLLPHPAAPSQPPLLAPPLLNDGVSKSRVLGSLFLSICIFFPIFLISPIALYGIYILPIPTAIVSDQTFPASDSGIQLYLIYLCGCHTGISNLAYLMWNSWVTTLPPDPKTKQNKNTCFSYKLPYLSWWHYCPTNC